MSSFKWSFTKVDTFYTCLRRFKFQFVDKVKVGGKVNAFAIGEGLHRFLEYYSLNPQASLQECQAVYTKAALKHPDLEDKAMVPANLGLVQRYMESGKRLEPLRDTTGAPITERWFSIRCGSGVTCIGKIDLVTQNHAVVDYKSASRPFQQLDVEETLTGKGLQLTIYGAAYDQWFGKPPAMVGFQVLVKNNFQVQNLGSYRSAKHIQDVKDLIVITDQKFLALKSFPKNKFAQCHWCPYRDLCAEEE